MDWRDAAREEYRQKREALAQKRGQAHADIVRLQAQLAALDAEIANLDTGARAFGLNPIEGDPRLPLDLGPSPAKASPPKGGTNALYKDIVLDLLREAYPAPMQAAEVQQRAENRLGRPVHWKTTGMTLYRLKKDGLARREKRDWYFLPDAPGDDEQEPIG